MAQFLEPRIIRLSWRSPEAGGVDVAPWVERLKRRLKVFPKDTDGRPLRLQDVNERGADRAEVREGAWTDFVALYTIDYCLRCGDEGTASELYEAFLRRGEDGHQLWLVRLDDGDPSESVVGDFEPWREIYSWQVLPAPYPSEKMSTQDERALHYQCVEPLRARGVTTGASGPQREGEDR